MDRSSISNIFQKIISDDKNYLETLNISCYNSTGKIWLIGGAIYNSLIFENSNNIKDYDYIVENKKELFLAPDKYNIQKNRFGGIKCISNDNQLDFMVLKNMFEIKGRKLEATIENHLEIVPLNIHSIAYDIESKKIIGEIGLKSIKEKVIRINNIDTAKRWSNFYNKKLEDMIIEKANKLGFDYDLTLA